MRETRCLLDNRHGSPGDPAGDLDGSSRSCTLGCPKLSVWGQAPRRFQATNRLGPFQQKLLALAFEFQARLPPQCDH
jgi:hypothetical protein